jgi:MoaA/NifB/PqqE/SkfB family radical SAM enzyme
MISEQKKNRNQYIQLAKRDIFPRIPLVGCLDLTYRCNNDCRHCWVRAQNSKSVIAQELTSAEIHRILREAQSLGCKLWRISGGEVMLRPNFIEILEFISESLGSKYSINTNGTLITPQIAHVLKKGEAKVYISLYGATPEIHDHITRNPGSFEKTMQGMAYLQEAGVTFIPQVVPMRDNWHQWQDMRILAKKLSPVISCGASWLYLSADHDHKRNQEISAQRLPPETIVEIDTPDFPYYEWLSENVPTLAYSPESARENVLFSGCIENRREFHIDPYGQMSFCAKIKDSSLRCDLRQGTFREAWEDFIPSLGSKINGGVEYQENCGTCELRKHCKWCAVYAYLETGRYSAPIPYLCEAAKKTHEYELSWRENHTKYFEVAGINIKLISPLNVNTIPWQNRFEAFSVNGPGKDNIVIRHYFFIPDLTDNDFGEIVYKGPTWVISWKNSRWYYRAINQMDGKLWKLLIFSEDYSRLVVFHLPENRQMRQDFGYNSLTGCPTDQILLCPLLPDRQAVLLHSAAAIINGKGLVFLGHSSAGKSTTMELIKSAKRTYGLQAEVLCDDRNIIRKWADGWRVHGTWHHGSTPDVSSKSAPLAGVFFIKKDSVNEISKISERMHIWKELLSKLIRSMVTKEWWSKEMEILEHLLDSDIPFYDMRFDKSGKIVQYLDEITRTD